jgi:hypothetical protein
MNENDIVPVQSVVGDAMAKLLAVREANATRHDIKVGDEITFKAITMYGSRKATRKVKAIDSSGRPRVRYDGWDDFQVRWNEIKAINGWEVE